MWSYSQILCHWLGYNIGNMFISRADKVTGDLPGFDACDLLGISVGGVLGSNVGDAFGSFEGKALGLANAGDLLGLQTIDLASMMETY